jgi:hypothetical protein
MGSLFGFELQTSGNVFVSGVNEREVAFEHKSGLLTLEGDETTTPNATAELEFVTVACKSATEATEAIGYAQSFAQKLADQAAAAPGGLLTFTADQRTEDGVWKKACHVRIADLGFRAQAQVTVGVPLAELERFIQRVLTRSGLADIWEQAILVCVETALKGQSSPRKAELRGFLAACALFLVRARPPMQHYTVAASGEPWDAGKRDWPIFDFAGSAYIKSLVLEPWVRLPETNFPAESFRIPAGAYPVPVNLDSPKSLFNLLPRTDFYSMFHALPPGDQEFLAQAGIDAIWPLLLGPGETYDNVYVFSLPYRCDPDASDAEARAGAGLVRSMRRWRPDGRPVDSDEMWRIVDHGPSVREWWDSVRNGDPKRPVSDGNAGHRNLAKDAASPPPGWRGRDPQYISSFPTPTENKKEYYGMGAFPMDPRAASPLAVFEMRDLMSDKEVQALGHLVPRGAWQDLLKIVLTHYVPGV